MGEARGTARLAAPPGEVWRFVTDPARFAAWIDGYSDGEVTSAHRLGVGARYAWSGRIGPVKLGSVEEIVAWDEGRRVAYRGAMAGVAFDSSMEVEPAGGGSTIALAVRFRVPARLGGPLTDALLVTPVVRSSIARSLARLRSVRF